MASAVDYQFGLGPHRPGVLKVVAFQCREALSEPYALEVELEGEVAAPVKEADVLGKRGTLTMVAHGDTPTRLLGGTVTEFFRWHAGDSAPTRLRYRARVRPQFWVLSHNQRYRFFQEQTAPEIVQAVLAAEKVTVRSELIGRFRKRDYCVQFGESDFTFVSRLLEEEGISYRFEHQQDQEVMVLVNRPPAPDARPQRLTYKVHAGAIHGEESVSAVERRQSVESSAVMVRDFLFDLPANADGKAGDAQRALEVYEFPAGYDQPGDADALAKVRLEQERALADRFLGTANYRTLAPGGPIVIEQHPVAELNAQLQIVEVVHRGQAPEVAGAAAGVDGNDKIYECSFVAVPHTVTFRPARRTPRPLARGSQTALVTGPAAEEIYTDQFGRIKVQFHWDRDSRHDDRSSCWVRVAQPWAGAGWGVLAIPRVGHEVVVDFLDGNPDRPVVTGSVYNGMNPPPFQLPGGKTRSTIRSRSTPKGQGSNEITFEDSVGHELLYIQAEKDLSVLVKNDEEVKVQHDQKLEVGRNRSRTVGGNQTLTVGGNDQSNVTGSQSITVGGNRSRVVTGADTVTVGAARTVAVGAANNLAVGAASIEVVGGFKTVTVGGEETLTVGGAMNETIGGSSTETVGADRSETIGGKKTETVGGDHTLTVAGSATEEVKKNRTVKIGGDLTITSAGKFERTVGGACLVKAKEITLAAEESFTLKAGKAVIEIKKDGTISINGEKIDVTAKGDLSLKGQKIQEN